MREFLDVINISIGRLSKAVSSPLCLSGFIQLTEGLKERNKVAKREYAPFLPDCLPAEISVFCLLTLPLNGTFIICSPGSHFQTQTGGVSSALLGLQLITMYLLSLYSHCSQFFIDSLSLYLQKLYIQFTHRHI